VFDVDMFDLPGMEENPHAAWKKVQDEKPPVFWTLRHGGNWMEVKPKEFLEIQNDSFTYSMKESRVPRNPRPFPARLIDMDPPEHAKWRIILSPAFSPKTVVDAEDMVRQFAIDLI
jgi:cytochrome P450